jgi:hypothetical protein
MIFHQSKIFANYFHEYIWLSHGIPIYGGRKFVELLHIVVRQLVGSLGNRVE